MNIPASASAGSARRRARISWRASTIAPGVEVADRWRPPVPVVRGGELDGWFARATVAAMSLASIVAENLRAARAERSLSQQDVARKAKVSVSYVSMLERGERTPPLATLEVLAKALATSPLDLLGAGGGRRRSKR